MFCMGMCPLEHTTVHSSRRGVVGNVTLQKFQVSTCSCDHRENDMATHSFYTTLVAIFSTSSCDHRGNKELIWPVIHFIPH